ncbi:hypothetical protein GUA46_15890 [Muricauda sp. HICW]|uniref:Uncharacterized protein n=1 Tax=Flagellimonas chongwuensis TaxID=2697365 RepID=A0A850NMM4_9FLAO|nr:YqcI/YcgG family protein [Allomuricauda chongwuensis]NVN19822.1 hypothetical protein [Allomuricauda chongwuensis]
MVITRDITVSEVEQRFRSFTLTKDHPCLMAQTVFNLDNVTLKTYTGLGTKTVAKVMWKDIDQYIKAYDFSEKQLPDLHCHFSKPINIRRERV